MAQLAPHQETHEERLRQIEALVGPFRARAAASDAAAVFPRENFDDLGRLDMLALTADEESGGHGLWSEGRFLPYYETLEALAYADTSTAQLLQVHSHALGFLSRHATPEQRERLLHPIVQGKQLLASVGSETAPVSTTAGTYTSELVDDGDGYVLTCTKHFASLAPDADHLLIWTAVPGSDPYPDRTVTVLVPRTAPEVTLVDEWDSMGMRPTVSWGVRIEGFRVDPLLVIGEPGAWVRDDPRTFTLAFAANHVGVARAALDFATDWARERPYLGESELVQAAIGELAAQVLGARSAVFTAARAWDDGDWRRAEALSLMAVHLAKRAGLDATRRAFEICGARTSFRLYPLEMWYRDIRTLTLHVRDDMQMRELGRGLLAGEGASKLALDTSVIHGRNA
jgi:alkylation response protein AidB-like acyl-CoA dehydrogenase